MTNLDGNLNTGVTGAKRATYKMKGPRKLLESLIKQYPTYTESENRVLFKDRVTEEDRDIIMDWFHANQYRALMNAPRKAPTRPPQYQKTLSELFASIRVKGKDDIKAREDKISVNFTEMMDGIYQNILKITFAECATAGGWFVKLSGMGEPNQKVGDVLTLEQVKAVFVSST